MPLSLILAQVYGWRLPTKDEVSNLLSNTYTTRSWFEGIGEGTGGKVVTKEGKELWFPNAGWRNDIGITGSSPYAPGQIGQYRPSTGSDYAADYFEFYSSFPAGGLVAGRPEKLRARSVRCVR